MTQPCQATQRRVSPISPFSPLSPVSPRHHAARRLLAQGLSMVELLCALALSAVLMGGAVPMFQDLRTATTLHATASLLETDMQYARSMAIVSGQPVRLAVLATAGGGSCYLLYSGAANGCSCEAGGQSRCDAGSRLLRLEQQAAHSGVTLAPLARSILFDGNKGTVTPTATVQVLAADGRAIHQVINIMGRVRSCTPSGGVGGLPVCR